MILSNDKLNIVIIGYYGKLNYGDDLLQHSITELFKDHNLLFTSWFPGIDLLNLADLVVVGGGSIWPGNTVFQHGKEIAKKLTTPIIFLGISAKQENRKIQESTQYLIDKSLYFHVRDIESKNIINHDKIVTGTDLYWWSSHQIPEIDPAKAQHTLLNLRSWDAEQWNPSSVFSTISENTENLKPFPLFFGSAKHEASGSIQDAELLDSLGMKNTPKAIDLSNLNGCNLMISMRFHGLLIAMRAGIPTIGFDYHRKTKNLFKDNNLNELCCSLNDLSSIQKSIQTVRNNQSLYYEKFEALKRKYLEEGIQDKLKFEKSMEAYNLSPRYRRQNALNKLKVYIKKTITRTFN